jgi:hypothetical protein
LRTWKQDGAVANYGPGADLNRLGRRALIPVAAGLVKVVVEYFAEPSDACAFADQHARGCFDGSAAANLGAFADDDLTIRLGVQLDRKLGGVNPDSVANCDLATAVDPDQSVQFNITPEVRVATDAEPDLVDQ